jgi:hypothetical protein
MRWLLLPSSIKWQKYYQSSLQEGSPVASRRPAGLSVIEEKKINGPDRQSPNPRNSTNETIYRRRRSSYRFEIHDRIARHLQIVEK